MITCFIIHYLDEQAEGLGRVSEMVIMEVFDPLVAERDSESIAPNDV